MFRKPDSFVDSFGEDSRPVSGQVKRRLWFFMAMLAGGFVLIFYLTREPQFHGKPLSHWFRALDGPYTPGDVEAMKAIGKDALPLIAKSIRAKDSSLKRALMGIIPAQNPLHIQISSAQQKQTRAATAVLILGETARPLLPQLEAALRDGDSARPAARALMGLGQDGFTCVTNAERNPDREVRIAVALASDVLVHSGNPEKQNMFVPVLIDLLKDPEPDMRAIAVNALGQLKALPSLSVPALIPLVDDPQRLPRYHAALALGAFGMAATNAVPALLAYANRTGSATERQLIIQAIRKIDPGVVEAFPPARTR